MSTFYSQARTRADARDRLVTGFPLKPVNMLAPVGPADFAAGSMWPPSRALPRAERLQAYDALYLGDITSFVNDKTAANLVMNYFERVPTVITGLLMRKDPIVPEADLTMVQQFLSEGAMNAFRSGRAYFTKVGDKISSPQTSSVYDGENGEVYVVTTSTTLATPDGQPDTVSIDAVTPDGQALTWVHEYSMGRIEALIEGPTADAGGLAIADRPPRFNGWGKSLYDSLGPPVVTMALRLSSIDRIIEKNSHPLTLFPIALTDYSSFGSEGSPAQPQPNEINLAKFQQSIIDALDEDVLLMPDSATAPTKLEWGAVAMSAAMALIMDLRTEVSSMSGLPADVLNGMFVAVSGEALDRLLLALSSQTRMLHRQLHAAAQEVYGPFEWPNAFEVEDAEDDTEGIELEIEEEPDDITE